MNRNVFMPKRNSSELYMPFQYKDTKSPPLMELNKKQPIEYLQNEDKGHYSIIKKTEANRDIKDIERKTKMYLEQQRNINKIQLAPIKESIRPIDPPLYQKYLIDRDRSQKTLTKDPKSSQFDYPIRRPDNDQSSLETLKNLETLENLRKISPNGQSKPQFRSQVDLPIRSSEDLRANLALIEEMRKESDHRVVQRPKISHSEDFQKNMKKFFAVEEEEEKKEDEGELPNFSEFKNDARQPRYAKTNLKSIVRDPITGNTSNYLVDRPKPRALGSKAPEVFPGKIYDSPPQIKYELPKNTKKSPKSTIFNPLTHETIRIEGNGTNIFVSDTNRMGFGSKANY